ncbi:type II toxin-antitoxin system HipA family toxin [Candidatus Rhabdochlamydia oedothoracis]|uniref:type II toxin-antitoxin system HipA family toxin n=1 Tax=Candidatus Rhabdochlamydia oedothoracis TaxID=2720720 RepID=UPI0021132EB9|nr:HipA domain-containing protein [Candidatus Rhabdochlamydia oedothoracis]
MEYAYHLMAKTAHLCVSEAKLFPSKKGPGYFGVKRFDRVDGRRVHMHTISGLVHADYRFPSLDYETIMKATLWLTKDSQEGEKQFRATVFNVLSHNRDDHSKNFSFLMDEKGVWRVSPAYDLTFSSGPSGEHCSMIMKEGKNPTLSHLLKLAEISNIKKQKALQIIDEVKMAMAKWRNFAKDLGLSSTSFKMVQTALNHVNKTVFS